MKAIRRKQLNEFLNSLIPRWDGSDGWTYNYFYGTTYFWLGQSESLETLHAATQQVVAHFTPTELVVFHDGFAAWRTRWRGNRGFRCATSAEVIELINSEAYFRDRQGRVDNYNVISDDGRWMITYCHEDDWFLFAPQPDLDQLTELLSSAHS